MTDPVADMLTRLRNASSVFHESVDVPASKLKIELARILKEEGFLRDYRVLEDGPKRTIRMWLKYAPPKRQVITGIKRISRPGLRVYAKSDQIPRVLGGLGVAILSTSKGVLSDRDARKAGVGGEVICYVW